MRRKKKRRKGRKPLSTIHDRLLQQPNSRFVASFERRPPTAGPIRAHEEEKEEKEGEETPVHHSRPPSPTAKFKVCCVV